MDIVLTRTPADLDRLFAYYLITRLAYREGDVAKSALDVLSCYENTFTSLVALCSTCAQGAQAEPRTVSVIELSRDHGVFAALAVHRMAMGRGEIRSCEYCGAITREEWTRRRQAEVGKTGYVTTPVAEEDAAFGGGEEGGESH